LATTKKFKKETLMLRTALFKLAILQPESYIKNLKCENEFKKKGFSIARFWQKFKFFCQISIHGLSRVAEKKEAVLTNFTFIVS